ncbi:MAG: glycosyltransferase family 2 protein [Paludibacteraceae bacterium]|nr:glycosyltransferase family 2 protein [Paludibacteraceae bacterium]
MSVKLSIITINLNNCEGLCKTIKSVILQTCNDYEYIVIDGASTDGSVDIIKQYEDKIAYWITEPDTGIYNAINKGILKATGEYCLFLNSGDYLVDGVLSDFFSTQVNKDIVYGNIILESDGKTICVDNSCGKDNLTCNDFFHGTIRHQGAFIRRSLFERFGLYDESNSIVSDWQFFIKSIVFGDATYEYRNINICYFDVSGIGSVFSEKHIQERNKVLKEFFPEKVIADYVAYNDLLQKHKSLQQELNRYEHRFKFFDRVITKLKNI